ncbi:type II toxin-antitoxin system Phd/YefM family antitoxin [uncultured Thiohalocapsa sp.]|uniref:type II toxin-antitoxin system Phd/YefM family antitoxin n=1 Tax=uncultured Thiohalocapsa sp. TaxID=768990 RepID=UPI0025D040DA|nr:type II toxin-antitoxin system prevent-host-death family antitoxin [uncultured Thiohalocapsa sp.]
MQSLTTTELRANLKDVLDHINDDREPVTIRRAGGKGVVLLDAEDYASIIETLHLVRHPANAERLQRGMAQHRAGEATEIDVAPYLD